MCGEGGEFPDAPQATTREDVAAQRHSPEPRRGGSRNDPRRNRCGCFLPDLTRLATTTSARLPRSQIGKPGGTIKRLAQRQTR